MAGGGEKKRERQSEREEEKERGQEDKPVWQVCVTVHSPSCKADGKRKGQRERSWELMSLHSTAFIINQWQHNGVGQVEKSLLE